MSNISFLDGGDSVSIASEFEFLAMVQRVQLTLADVVTISGSAFTPFVMPNWPLAMLLTMFNLRMGRWIPGPRIVNSPDTNSPKQPLAPAWKTILDSLVFKWSGHLPRKPDAQGQPETAGMADAPDDVSYFVADGGFDEFFGAIELLRRRCKIIIISDAGSNTGKDEFGCLAYLIRLARTELGIQFLDLDHEKPIDLERYRRGAEDKSRVAQQFFCCRVRYPQTKAGGEDASGSREGLVVYLQMSLSGREEIDLQQVRKKFPNFPDEPISNQFYSPQQSEAYRQLGYHIGKLVCRELPPWRDHPDFADTEPPCKKNTPSLPPQLRPLLSPQELESRLVLSYLTECQLEQSHDHSEVSIDRLFAPHRQDPTRFDRRCKAAFPEKSVFIDALVSETPESEEPEMVFRPSYWLAAYEQDADIRQAIRWFVYHSIYGLGVPSHTDILEEIQGKIDDETIRPRSRFLIAPIAVAVNELLVSDDSARWINLSIDDGIWQGEAVPVVSTQGTKPLASGAATFRIGGREILVTPLKEDHDIEDRAVGFTQIERRRLFRIAYDVFRAHGPATAMLTAHCLLRLRASSHEAKDAKDNGIYNREPVWSELRESLATHNQQEFERVLQNFEAAPVD